MDSVDLWRDFMQHARTVVQLFETYDFTDEELQQARAKQQKQTHHAAIGISSGGSSATGSSAAAPGTVAAGSATESGSGSDSGYSGCKYLTSSQLFSLQLRDPIVRQQVAVQILYFVHYLRYSAVQ